MLKVVGDEAVEDEADGRSLLDEIAREGARRMLMVALETEVAAYPNSARARFMGNLRQWPRSSSTSPCRVQGNPARRWWHRGG